MVFPDDVKLLLVVAGEISSTQSSRSIAPVLERSQLHHRFPTGLGGESGPTQYGVIKAADPRRSSRVLPSPAFFGTKHTPPDRFTVLQITPTAKKQPSEAFEKLHYPVNSL